jgi:uncharacterized protein
MTASALAGAVLIGLSLGLTGAGGSILTLPVLVYLAGIAPRDAVPLSLLVVGAVALVGAIQRARARQIHWPAVLWFSLSGMAGAALGAGFTGRVPQEALMISFAILMVLVAWRMAVTRPDEVPDRGDCRPLRCLIAGGGVGILTGFLGVGGGFLLVPALARFAQLPVHKATGTSLALIAVNSAAGFTAHLGSAAIDWRLAGIFSAIAIVGVLFGGRLAAKWSAVRLRQGFAALTLLTGLAVLWETLWR